MISAAFDSFSPWVMTSNRHIFSYNEEGLSPESVKENKEDAVKTIWQRETLIMSLTFYFPTFHDILFSHRF
ncbi:unnamed protein product [Nezara viridula]|uniref:Uncharacterized protein n=1 Tax=Nezara viridula TaxID=85310 RepID=A0A9P0H4T9_NEZVI|nr:unnamed protein product [Nezara viridula]